ncbi:MAG TPA: hypothetical protein VMW36_04315 [Patescibacteria group bacterium]|nr:hypothetical protein [Patescibacteria group bacterium]
MTRKTTPAPRTRKPKGRLYFTKVHENAIVKFASSDNLEDREALYRELIGPAFDELVDKIVYTYKFTNLPNISVLKHECKVDLATILGKFDPSKGSKAFSYFSVVTKNWFIHKTKKNTKQREREVYLEDLKREGDFITLSEDNPYHELRDDKEFWEHLMTEIDNWEGIHLKENEQKVLKAIKILFENAENIEIFNKKAVYLYLREITDLNTKQIVNNLNKLRVKYRTFRNKWDECDV